MAEVTGGLMALIGGVWVSIGELLGATGIADGRLGVVPTPLAGQETRFLRGDGTWAAPSAMGGAQLESFGANRAIAGPSPAGITSRNGHPIVTFSSTVDQNADYSGQISRDYANAALTADLYWAAATAIVGDVKWDLQFERLAAGGQDLDVDGFAAARTGTSTTAGAAGVLTLTSITFTQAQADSIVAGDPLRCRLTRDTTVVGNMAGLAQVLILSLRQ